MDTAPATGPKRGRWPTIALGAVLVAAAAGLVAVGVAVGVGGGDDAPPTGGVSVDDAWTAPNQSLTAVYLTITNAGEDDRLTGVATGQAGQASIMGGDADTADMGSEGTSPVDLPVPNGTTTLQPGGRHLMLENLTGPLQPGDTFTLRLTFQRAGSVTVPVEVVSWDEAVERAEQD